MIPETNDAETESRTRTALLKLHAAIFLAGFTGIFGKLIHLREAPLVWWRLAMVIAVLYPALRIAGTYRRPPTRELFVLYGIGALQGVHWVLFYGSIKMSTVSVGLVCLSLMGFFTALFSPLVLHTRWSGREFVYSGLTIAGIGLIFHFDTHYRLGIAVGCVSSVFAALFIVCNKRVTQRHENQTVLLHHEMCGGFVTVSILLPALLRLYPGADFLPTASDFAYLAVLAVLCTIVMNVLQLQALRVVSAFTVNLSFNLEPVYSIILAALLLGEGKTFTASFYLGLSLIILSVLLQTRHALGKRC